MYKFNVMIWDFNSDTIKEYDVLPYFRDEYYKAVQFCKTHKPDDYWKVPKTFEELKEFIDRRAQHRFWGQCEYEMICHGWPVQKNKHKLNVYEQIVMNIDIITTIIYNEINQNKLK